MKRFNVAIIGGGMVGAALAASLKQTHLSVVLVDAFALQAEDARLIALNDSSVRFLENIGLWSLLSVHAGPIQQIHVSHRGHFGVTRLDCRDVNVSALGYVVPARHINTALYDAISSEITLIRPARLTALMQTEQGASLTISTASGEEVIEADVVMGADGSDSTVRHLLGISIEEIDYQQSALVTKTTLRRDHDHIAYERFQSAGAIALLPLPNREAATIWTAPNDQIKTLLALSDTDFLAELQRCFGYRLGRFLRIDKRACYPLKNLRAKERLKQNVLLIGNAAHTFHPIASQGLNLALYEVACVANYLKKITGNITLSDMPLLPQHELFSQRLSHHLTWLFANDFFVLNWMRQVGMVGLDVLPSLKKQFALRAMGQYPH